MQADSPAVFKLIEPIEADSRSRRDHRKIAPTCDQHAKKLESEMKSARTVRSDRWWWRCCNQAITPTTWRWSRQVSPEWPHQYHPCHTARLVLSCNKSS